MGQGVNHPHKSAVVTELSYPGRRDDAFVVLVQREKFEEGGFQVGGQADVLGSLIPIPRCDPGLNIQWRTSKVSFGNRGVGRKSASGKRISVSRSIYMTSEIGLRCPLKAGAIHTSWANLHPPGQYHLAFAFWTVLPLCSGDSSRIG